jgi:hypothetical protein
MGQIRAKPTTRSHPASTEPGTERIAIYLPKDLARWLRHSAVDRDVSLSERVREILEHTRREEKR